jgi:hypothetical protein
METNYELKHKCLLVPLKAVLLVLVMLLVGFTTFAQSGKSVRVANNEQLIEAMHNPAISTIELQPGYYAEINYQANEVVQAFKSKPDNGNREALCTYLIIGDKLCYIPDDQGFSPLNLFAYFYDGNVPLCNCCPSQHDSGIWSVTAAPSGSNHYFPGNDSTLEFNTFYADTPGEYILRYTWPSTQSHVETPYYLFGQVSIDVLEGEDVCGLTTPITYETSSPYWEPGTTWTWTLDGLPYAGPTGPEGTFDLTVGECGLHELCLTVTPGGSPALALCSPVTECIIIDFSCMPTADAGPDINVCNELCVLLVGSTGLTVYSPTYAYSWYQTSGPGTLSFIPDPEELTVLACIDPNPPCEYGKYTVEFQVQNGQCYDEDEATLRFYQQPIANAGPDQHLCNVFAFDLAAVPFAYCGTEGINYWSTAQWELVSSPAGSNVVFDASDPLTAVSITGTGCIYGEYTFKWSELNSEGPNLGGCYAEDFVTVYIYETPVPDAGDDMVFCDTFAFSLWGSGDEPCYQNTVVQYSWEKTSQPGDCLIEFSDLSDLNPDVVISGCDPDLCPYGEYIFTLTQSNGYLNDAGNFVEVCSGEDAVSYWIFEPVDADAGADQHICDNFAFTLTAIPTPFCGVEDVNYKTWGVWTQVSGPKTATIANPSNYVTGVTIADQSGCPYGDYQFKWTEYNGMGTPFQGCEGFDLVDIYIYETPDVSAGDNQAYCETDIAGTNGIMFYLNGTIDDLCTDGAYQILWELVDQPGTCDVTFWYDNNIDPMVTITNCDPCQYGEYIFKVTQKNGYYDDLGNFVTVCEDSDEVSVWIYEQPEDVNAGIDQNLCEDYTFDLSGTGADYCGDFGVNYNNWYSWTLVSQPVDAGCEVTIVNGNTLTPSVSVANCTGPCPFGEFKFRLTEYNGTANVYCEAWDEVSIFIFEMPDAEAGPDVNECVAIGNFPYCDDMEGELVYCYSMYGVWTKSCGPGDVVFTDINDPHSGYCVDQPGRYKFTWTVTNDAEGCTDADEVIFDLLEEPIATGEFTELYAPCDDLCIDLGLAGIDKYQYTGLNEYPTCPNYIDMAHWTQIAGPGAVTFADDTDPETDMCVTYYGGYTVRWNEVNVAIDGESQCDDYFDVYVEFNKTPVPTAVGGEICGNCFTLDGTLDVSTPGTTFYWEVLPGGNCPVTIDINAVDPEVCIEDVAECYGTYGFVLHQSNGECYGTDTAYITFKQLPGELPICFYNNPNECGEMSNGGNGTPDFIYNGCLQPNQTLDVCSGGCSYFQVNPWCGCTSWFDFSNPAFWGWTFEWSLISPAGTVTQSQAGYFDFENGNWVYPWIDICWGECCDTARLYLTITTDQDCETTSEYKFFVHHKPCVDIVGPDVAEVGMTSTYCNNCPPNPCLLYDWTAEHCGHIVSGQGTPCIDVLWDSYNVNGGWGQITLTVFDTCTGCCNYDEMPVKIYPTGTLGDATLSGHVYYHNNGNTPLNGVEIQLWNGGIPVQSTTSFNDIEGGNGVGYYEFTGVNSTTNFGVTASYDAPWYGANATDALAVELKTINNLPGGFIYDDVVEEAMNVNNSVTPLISSVDALWIKQRAINMVNYFPAGNWAFDQTMSTQAGVFNILALSMGDANRSNIPNSNKSMPAIDLVNDGTMNVVTGQVFSLPIRIAKASQFGAMTLNLEYNPSLIQVVDVNSVDGMLNNVTSGNVSIAWSNLNPMVLADNDVVVTLKVKAIGEIASTESIFSIGMGSEFADPTANVVEPVTLKSFGITTAPAALDYFLSANRPNPFSTYTTIEYTMPETGKVKLSVLDMLGQEIAVLVDATQTAGSYSVDYSAAGLATGVYLYKITVDGETRDFISTQRMVVSH